MARMPSAVAVQANGRAGRRCGLRGRGARCSIAVPARSLPNRPADPVRGLPHPVLLAVVLGAIGCVSLPRCGPSCSANLAAKEGAVRTTSASYATVHDVETEMAEFRDDVWSSPR